MMTHRKFRRLVALTGLPEAHIRGLLECLWDVTYENGDPFIGDSTDVEAAARWTGRPGDLTAALLAAGGEGHCGYIDPAEGAPGRFVVHDLYDHAPEYVKNRWRREQVRKAAGSHFRKAQSISDRSVTDQASITHPSLRVTPAPAPAPAPSAKEEKEKNSGGESAPAEGRILLVFPCLRGTKSSRHEWHLLDTFVADVEAVYPEMDVLAESRKAMLWLKTNGLKTYAGMGRFLNGWYSRANNRRDFIGRGSSPLAIAPPRPALVIGSLSLDGSMVWNGKDWDPVPTSLGDSAAVRA